MDYRKHTKTFVILVVSITLIYDLFVMIKAGAHSTITGVVIDWSYEMPFIPFLCGFVCGHLFWKAKTEIKDG